MKRAAFPAAAFIAAAGLPLAVAGPASAATVYVVTATISVGTGPSGVAIDPTNGTVYVANNGSASVSAISAATNKVTATIGVGTNPVGVAVDPVTHSVWVADNAGAVSEISDATNTVTHTIRATEGAGLGNPYGIVADSAIGTVYFTDNVTGATWQVNEATDAEGLAYQSPGGNSTGIAIDSATGNIYPVGANGFAWPFTPVTDNDLGAIQLGTLPYGIAYDSANNFFYVANYGDGTVSVINPDTYSLIATIPVGTQPVGVAVNPGTDTVYVTNLGSNNVSVISDTSNTVIATVPVGKGPYADAVNTSTGAVYVANSGDNTVSVISPNNGPSSGGSVTANATVNQAVSLTGLTGTITFPAANPGTTSTANAAEAYTAFTSDPAGYTLTLAAGGSALTSSGGGSIPNNDLSVTETSSHPGTQTFGAASGAVLTLAQTTAASSDSYSENWALAIPSGTAATTYSESFVYLVLGN